MASGSKSLFISDHSKIEGDVFFKTELELAKVRRLYHNLEKELDHERNGFQLKTQELQDRIFDLEARLHKEKMERMNKKEEEVSRRKQLEANLQNQKVKFEERILILEETLRDTKEAWSARLEDERKTWKQKNADKVRALETQLEDAREYYKEQLHHLKKELANVHGTNLNLHEDLDSTKKLYEEEKNKANRAKAELEDFKDKYRRCMDLASDLLVLRKKHSSVSVASKSKPDFVSSSSTSRPWTAHASSPTTHVPSATRKTITAATQENEILRKQLKLTKILLDDEVRKNSELSQDLAKFSLSSAATTTL